MVIFVWRCDWVSGVQMFVYGVVGSIGYFQVSVFEQFCDIPGFFTYVSKCAPLHGLMYVSGWAGWVFGFV
jgi:hypothetical protein